MAKALSVIAVLILILVLGLAFLLVPAHVQVRSVSSGIPSDDALHALRRTDGPISIQYINTSEQDLGVGTLTHSVFVLTWPDGSRFMIDAGMSESEAVQFAGLIKTILGGQDPVIHGNIGDLLGPDIDSIEAVGFTHLHIDHTEGIEAFCDSRADSEGPKLIQTEDQRLKHNFNTAESAEILAGSCLTAADAIPGQQLSEIPGFPGLGILSLGGHTPGSTLFAAWLDDQLFLFSGDITNTKTEIRENTGKGLIYSNFLVPEDTDRTLELRNWLKMQDDRPNVRVVVSHDLEDILDSGLKSF